MAASLRGGAATLQLDLRQFDEIHDALYARRPASEAATRLKKLLTRRLRKHVETHKPSTEGKALWGPYVKDVEALATQVGLVLSRNPGAVMEERAPPPPVI